ncbi:hypothetical protein BST81_13670 [Leptolyngbya sp. 'hensonii']|uniref:caspase, EACC1-associated type n=1 Tax=Leptolyngbya sp. 'hensonii' TaxID=1922337 RepID=UPI000950290F|nr:caspase family protein [Leptolyngbya sp. 'hensonii']OLP18070.1 hypothetical protein BST81_13670 [Leptolyngbya sp. 'hensonii']
MARVALLIGVSNYGHGFQALPETPGDVDAIRQVLEDPEIGGFSLALAEPLIDPDPFQLLNAIEKTFTNARSEDLILLYFSGHGFKDETGALYFGTRLTEKNDRGQLVKSTAVPVRQVHELLNESPAQQQVIIIDCCFSGAFANSLSLESAPLSVETLLDLPQRERVILTASTSAQYSLTSMQYSYKQVGLDLSTYSYYLAEGIKTGAADEDGDGRISISELHEYTCRRVQMAAPAMQPKLYASEQGSQIKLARAPVRGPEQLYRREVTHWINRGKISPAGRQALELRRQDLQLSGPIAEAIEAAVLRPYQEHQQRLQRYEQVLLEAIQREYLLSEENQHRLERLRQVLGLSEENVAIVTDQIEEYGRCLQRYQQAMIDMVQREYPLDQYANQEMQRLQKVLGLTDLDTGSINSRVEEYRRRLHHYEQALIETLQQEYPLSPENREQLQRLQQMLELTDEDVVSIAQRVENYKQRLYQYQLELAELPWATPPHPPGTDGFPFWRSILNLPQAPLAPLPESNSSNSGTAAMNPGSASHTTAIDPGSKSHTTAIDSDSASHTTGIDSDSAFNATPTNRGSTNATAMNRGSTEPNATGSPTLIQFDMATVIPPPVAPPPIPQTPIAPPPIPQTPVTPPPIAPDPYPEGSTPSFPEIYGAISDNVRTNMGTAVLLGILLGVLLGGVGCLLIINLVPPAAAPGSPTPPTPTSPGQPRSVGELPD